MQHPDWLEYIEHTADEGILVHAPDLATLYARAAWGMVSVVADPDCVEETQSEPIAVSGRDRESLLVNWLSEINARMQTDHRIYSQFAVRRITDTEIEAELGGEPVEPEKHDLHTEIKAVTFHGLHVEEQDGAWKAQVIFDV